MQYCVLGAGLMGKAIVYDLLLQEDTEQVILCDRDEKQLNNVGAYCNTPLQGDSRLQKIPLDIKEENKLNNILQNTNVVISAIHYRYNLEITKLAIETKTHMCDLGGNSEIVDKQIKLSEDARKSNVTIIPDCGLAPGMVSVLVRWGIEKFNWCDTVKIRVGGLPQNPKGPLKYERLFSIDGLINEYIEPVRILRDGKIEIVEPLAEVEEIDFPSEGGVSEPRFQAFTTSGGTSTLIETYKDRLKNLDYKTIRYKEHLEELKKSGKSKFREIFSQLPICKEDLTLVKIIFEDGKGVARNAPTKKELTIVDYAKPPFTSMMRMTAFPVSIIAQMLARNKIKERGVLPQEKCVPVDLFISELKKREIVINGFN